jgi:hypothetical protein
VDSRSRAREILVCDSSLPSSSIRLWSLGISSARSRSTCSCLLVLFESRDVSVRARLEAVGRGTGSLLASIRALRKIERRLKVRPKANNPGGGTADFEVDVVSLEAVALPNSAGGTCGLRGTSHPGGLLETHDLAKEPIVLA